MVGNLHERYLPAPPAVVGALLDGLASPADALWPTVWWTAMRLDRPLGVGAHGGHGPIRYRVEHHDPGRHVRFRFEAPAGFDGFHEYAVLPGPRVRRDRPRHAALESTRQGAARPRAPHPPTRSEVGHDRPPIPPGAMTTAPTVA